MKWNIILTTFIYRVEPIREYTASDYNIIQHYN